jgi:hypothetical protein
MIRVDATPQIMEKGFALALRATRFQALVLQPPGPLLCWTSFSAAHGRDTASRVCADLLIRGKPFGFRPID